MSPQNSWASGFKSAGLGVPDTPTDSPFADLGVWNSECVIESINGLGGGRVCGSDFEPTGVPIPSDIPQKFIFRYQQLPETNKVVKTYGLTRLDDFEVGGVAGFAILA
jgi:hypothetical protein